jgi:hypothetical protein
MYALRFKGRFKCDWFYSMGDAGWKVLDEAYNILLFSNKIDAESRRNKLEIIYGRDNIDIVQLNDEDMHSITLAKLKFTGRSNS